MSLRTYGIPLVLVGLGIALGVALDEPAETTDFGSAPVAVADPVAASPAAPAADGSAAIDPSSGVPVQDPAPVPEAQPVPEADVAGAPSQPDTIDEAMVQGYPEPEQTYAGDVALPEVQDQAIGLPAEGFVPSGEGPYEVVTTNPMACIPDGAVGCSQGAYCCGDLVCIEDACVQSH